MSVIQRALLFVLESNQVAYRVGGVFGKTEVARYNFDKKWRDKLAKQLKDEQNKDIDKLIPGFFDFNVLEFVTISLGSI